MDRQLLWQNHHAVSPHLSTPTRYPAATSSVTPVDNRSPTSSRETEVEARQANVLTKDEARRIYEALRDKAEGEKAEG
jgi:hypothetical protein